MHEQLKIVSGVLQAEHKILLCLRKNTEFYPNHWAFPVGRLEAGENNIDALRRELFEEIGIQMISGENLTTLFDHEQNIEHVVYLVTEWRGEVHNREPELCGAAEWFYLRELPSPLTPSTERVIKSLECEV